MAKDEDEEEAAAEGEEGEGKKRGGKKLIIIIAAVVLLLGGGVAGAYFMHIGPFKKSGDEKAEAKSEKKEEKKEGGHGEKSEGGEKKEGAATVPGAPVIYNLPQILVNLNTGGKGTSFLKMKVALKLAKQEDVPAMEANLPVIQDALNTYLRELRASDLSGSAGMYRLREELLLRINKTVAPVKVEDILFQEMLVQ